MKHKWCCLLLALCLLATAGVAFAEAGGASWFTGEQLQAASGRDSLYLRQLVHASDGFYGYGSDKAVYRWDETGDSLQLYCQLPAFPKDSAAAYEDLPSEVKAQWAETVSFLAADEAEIWAVNVFAGRLGKILQSGVSWTDVPLDTEKMVPPHKAWPPRIVQAFVEGARLYVYVAHDDMDYPHNRYDLFAFDLATGACTLLDIKNAQGLCAYTPGSLLLLFYEQDQWATKAFDLAAGVLAEEAVFQFSAPDDKPVGGMVYDQEQQYLYLVSQGQLWRGRPEGVFESLGAVPLYELVGEVQGFLLHDGAYGAFDQVLYLRAMGQVQGNTSTLVLMGAIDDAIMQSFSEENPQVAIQPEYEMLSPEEIARRMVVRDGAADVYAAMITYPFYSMVNKGYAASLASSSILSADIAVMYPNIRQALQDRQGNPIAYPHMLHLGNWSVNITLWKAVYGDQPLPETVDQMLDAMKAWEETHAEQHLEASFASGFDYVDWIRTIVNIYVQQRVVPGQPVTLQDPLLRSALEKLAEIQHLRQDNGRNVVLAEDEMPPIAVDLFYPDGNNNILRTPLNPALFDMTYEELPDGVYQDMPPLVMEPGETPQWLGKLMVWFVNPYSENRELAIRFLEHAARPENNLVMYYGAHPDVNDPVEAAGYPAKKAEQEAAVADLTAQLEKEGLSPEEKDNLTDQLAQAKADLADLELYRWIIHPGVLAQYRKLAPQIHFYEENPYLMQLGEKSDGLSQVMDIYQSYADGTLTLDAFLAQLEGKLNMIQKEG